MLKTILKSALVGIVLALIIIATALGIVLKNGVDAIDHCANPANHCRVVVNHN